MCTGQEGPWCSNPGEYQEICYDQKEEESHKKITALLAGITIFDDKNKINNISSEAESIESGRISTSSSNWKIDLEKKL